MRCSCFVCKSCWLSYDRLCRMCRILIIIQQQICSLLTLSYLWIWWSHWARHFSKFLWYAVLLLLEGVITGYFAWRQFYAPNTFAFLLSFISCHSYTVAKSYLRHIFPGKVKKIFDLLNVAVEPWFLVNSLILFCRQRRKKLTRLRWPLINDSLYWKHSQMIRLSIKV